MSKKDRVYDAAELATKLSGLAGWTADGGWIRRRYQTDGWLTTLALVNTIGYVAEAANHHPDLTVSWNKVGVSLQTHSAGGVTDKDLELARRLEDTALWRPSGGALAGTPNAWVQPSP